MATVSNIVKAYIQCVFDYDEAFKKNSNVYLDDMLRDRGLEDIFLSPTCFCEKTFFKINKIQVVIPFVNDLAWGNGVYPTYAEREINQFHQILKGELDEEIENSYKKAVEEYREIVLKKQEKINNKRNALPYKDKVINFIENNIGNYETLMDIDNLQIGNNFFDIDFGEKCIAFTLSPHGDIENVKIYNDI